MTSTLPACQCIITCESSGCSYAVQRILNVEYGFPPNIRVSDDCKDLMKQILVDDPSRRLSIPQIMEHPWSVNTPSPPPPPNDTLPPTDEQPLCARCCLIAVPTMHPNYTKPQTLFHQCQYTCNYSVPATGQPATGECTLGRLCLCLCCTLESGRTCLAAAQVHNRPTSRSVRNESEACRGG